METIVITAIITFAITALILCPLSYGAGQSDAEQALGSFAGKITGHARGLGDKFLGCPVTGEWEPIVFLAPVEGFSDHGTSVCAGCGTTATPGKV